MNIDEINQVNVACAAYATMNIISFKIPNEYINKIKLYRDNKLIAESKDTEKKGGPLEYDLLKPFELPSMFETDHHTNLFKKFPRPIVLYKDEDVRKYRTYKYEIVLQEIKDNKINQEIKYSCQGRNE